MSFEIEWKRNFYGISWAYEKDRLVISTVFEDKKEAMLVAQEVEDWSDKFTRLTIIEKDNDEFAICCYQDPQISKKQSHIGLFRTGMRQSGGYEQAKPMVEEKSPLLQIAYAADVRDMNTYSGKEICAMSSAVSPAARQSRRNPSRPYCRSIAERG